MISSDPSASPPAISKIMYKESATHVTSNCNDTTPSCNDTTTELSRLHCKHLMQQYQYPPPSPTIANKWRMGVGPMRCTGANVFTQCSISNMEICSTALSIVMRALTVCINVKLAVDYSRQGQQDYFIWTVVCIATPMIITMLIHANM